MKYFGVNDVNQTNLPVHFEEASDLSILFTNTKPKVNQEKGRVKTIEK